MRGRVRTYRLSILQQTSWQHDCFLWELTVPKRVSRYWAGLAAEAGVGRLVVGVGGETLVKKRQKVVVTHTVQTSTVVAQAGRPRKLKYIFYLCHLLLWNITVRKKKQIRKNTVM